MNEVVLTGPSTMLPDPVKGTKERIRLARPSRYQDINILNSLSATDRIGLLTMNKKRRSPGLRRPSGKPEKSTNGNGSSADTGKGEAAGSEIPAPQYPYALDRRHPHDLDTEISAHLDEVRKLAQQSLREQEDQKRMVSRELHDNIAQILCSVTNRITLAQDQKIPAWLRQELVDLREQLDTALEDVRTLARDLRPHLLDTAGFAVALEKHVEGFRSRTPISIDVRVDLDSVAHFDKSDLTHLFRLVQEALQNVEEHSGASKARVHLQASDGMLRLEISDNGCSFTPERVLQAQANGHLGLLGMRERAELLGGSFMLEAKPDQGTTVRAFFPMNKTNE
ncbi:MAG: sensor histidine kinase [Chthoniobacterales bacterium]|nr:sensor histidine kinase [Chthoniobacterales bacterium]